MKISITKSFLFLTTIFLSICFTSCNGVEDHFQETCINHFLIEFDMKPYEEEILTCKTHIRLYQYEEIYFAYKINHCVDFVPFAVYDCSGEEFCITSRDPCYLEESIDLGIIGIER